MRGTASSAGPVSSACDVGMNRKRFLLISALVAAASASRWMFLDSSSPAPPDHALLRPDFLSRVLTDSELHRVGLLYRAAYPQENSIHVMVNRLLDARPTAAAVAAGPVVAGHLARQIAADFAAGRTVILDGWVLALTEARQCALYSMLLG